MHITRICSHWGMHLTRNCRTIILFAKFRRVHVRMGLVLAKGGVTGTACRRERIPRSRLEL